MKVIFLIFLSLFTSNIIASSSERFVFKDCWYSIALSNNWSFNKKPSSKNNCELEVVNPKINANISISVGYKEYLILLREQGFDYFNNEWVTVGRQGSKGKAEKVILKHWHGFKGIVASGCHNEKGYVGICSSEILVLRESEMVDGNTLIVSSSFESPVDFTKIYNSYSARILIAGYNGFTNGRVWHTIILHL
jgi:hypothetical protein